MARKLLYMAAAPGGKVVSIWVALNHRTTYVYDREIGVGPQIVRLRPAPHCRTPILSYSLEVEPKDQFLNWQQDPYSNWLARLIFNKPTRHFSVEVDLVADIECEGEVDDDRQEIAPRGPAGGLTFCAR